MKYSIVRLFFISLVSSFLFISTAPGQNPSDADDRKAAARNFTNQMVQERFSDACKNFDSTMNVVLPPERLRDIWKTLKSQVGSPLKQLGERTEKSGLYDVVFISYQFERVSLDIKIIFNNKRQIAGLFFVPPQTTSEYIPPRYVKPETYREKEVIVGKGAWALPGTITIPTGPGPFPAIVLVHGSGPNDRDESIGPNKVFRDIAWGLASQGIAVLRYEKRTKVYATTLLPLKDSITVKEETVDDALAAVSLLYKMKEIDTTRIFVLGHSLGGTLIPRIGISNRSIYGFVIMAGATRPMEDVMLEQMNYLASLDSSFSEDKKSQLEKIKTQIARVKDPHLSLATPAMDLPLGVSPRYWLDLRGYSPAELARNVAQPILIIQGERDYQVTMQDFNGWKNALSLKKNVEFKVYPALNHLFIPGKGISTPTEYQTVGHVAEEVINDIASWIKSHED